MSRRYRGHSRNRPWSREEIAASPEAIRSRRSARTARRPLSRPCALPWSADLRALLAALARLGGRHGRGATRPRFLLRSLRLGSGVPLGQSCPPGRSTSTLRWTRPRGGSGRGEPSGVVGVVGPAAQKSHAVRLLRRCRAVNNVACWNDRAGSRLRALIAPDCFGDTMTAVVAAHAIADGWRRARPDDRLILAPQSDGGPGFVEARGLRPPGDADLAGPRPGPLAQDVDAKWVYNPTTATAYIESAQACGLASAGGPPTVDTAWDAHSRGGTADRRGSPARRAHHCRRLGGSGCTDGGRGWSKALGGIDEAGRKLAGWIWSPPPTSSIRCWARPGRRRSSARRRVPTRRPSRDSRPGWRHGPPKSRPSPAARSAGLHGAGRPAGSARHCWLSAAAASPAPT